MDELDELERVSTLRDAGFGTSFKFQDALAGHLANIEDSQQTLVLCRTSCRGGCSNINSTFAEKMDGRNAAFTRVMELSLIR